MYRSRWPCGQRGGSTAAPLLRFWVRIPPRAWMSVFCGRCVLSGRGLCYGPISRPEESYWLCVSVCHWVWVWVWVFIKGSEPHGPDAPRPQSRPFRPHVQSRGPWSFTEAPDGPQAYTLNVLRLQEKGAQLCVSEWGQSLTFTKNMGRGFLHHPTFPTRWTVLQS